MINDAAADDSIRPITKIVKFGAIAMIPLPMIKVNNVHNKLVVQQIDSLI